jgi:hypothetical protein
MKSSTFWVIGFFEKFIAKNLTPGTPRLKSMIFYFKMRYFPAFYVVVQWLPQPEVANIIFFLILYHINIMAKKMI